VFLLRDELYLLVSSSVFYSSYYWQTQTGGYMTRLEFIDLVKNMGGDAIVADAIGCSVRTLGRMKASGLIASQYRGAVKIKQINKVML